MPKLESIAEAALTPFAWVFVKIGDLQDWMKCDPMMSENPMNAFTAEVPDRRSQTEVDKISPGGAEPPVPK